MASSHELDAMKLALDAAQSGPTCAEVSPNPRVGAVVLNEAAEIVGRGVHQGPGSLHAEVLALNDAGESARGGTVVVTLEPCRHQGLTGPCVQAVIDAGVSKVVYAVPDANPEAGGGAQMLADAGIVVEGGVMEDESIALNQRWLTAVGRTRPWVVLKVAATLDGKVAASDGSSKWITGDEARLVGHSLRGELDAIVVGTNTAILDDPKLTDRSENAMRQPLRAVVGKRELPEDLKLFGADGEFIQIASHDPHEVLATLFEKGVRTVLIEGGPTLSAAFLSESLVDEIYWFTSPTILGAGVSGIADFGASSLSSKIQGEITSVSKTGRDLLLRIDLRHD